MSPFGMALVGHRLYVANSDSLASFPYADGDTRITAPPTRVVDLPAGPINHHGSPPTAPAPGSARPPAASATPLRPGPADRGRPGTAGIP
jgi:hypothetical protein